MSYLVEIASRIPTSPAGAPIGTVLVGPSEFISKARRFRKLFGGGMRQTGYLAACAAYALTHNFSRLSKVHALARRLEARLEQIGARITTRAETCMVRLICST
jgi:threonine aldolase